jgi:hypothetical protein
MYIEKLLDSFLMTGFCNYKFIFKEDKNIMNTQNIFTVCSGISSLSLVNNCWLKSHLVD